MNSTTDPRMDFGSRVREVRRRRGLTQEQLGLDANLHPTYISSLEGGKRNVSVIVIYRLAAALSVSPREFFPE